MDVFLKISNFVFILSLSFYLITCLQWFSYKINRIIFHFTKPLWHLYFFIFPVFLNLFLGEYFFIYFYFLFLPSLYLWHKKLDKKLVFTSRIQRFFLFNFIILLIVYYFNFNLLFSIGLTILLSNYFEKINILRFKRKAKNKLKSIPNLKIILITASFGKTSIKNYLFEILKDNFNCYKTPRSINTLNGLIQDINDNLNQNCEIYIAEGGARIKGDIKDIALFLEPEIVIIGEIGSGHLEYFKNIQNIKNTKREALLSPKLKKAFLHSLAYVDGDDCEIYDKDVNSIKSNLDSLSFKIKDEFYKCSLLGEFNAYNLAACIKVSKFLGLNNINIQNLKNPEHRLQKIIANGKIIIDDSFNGNLKGMLSSYDLVNTFDGRKVIITPGIVESDPLDNEILSKKINKIFDLVMLSGEINLKILSKYIDENKLIIIKDKSKIQEILIKNTRAGDLILFSNDSPNFM